MISYEPFWNTLEAKGVTTYTLIHKKGINSNIINRIKKGASLTTYTLNNLCKALDCSIPDIVEYIKDDDE